MPDPIRFEITVRDHLWVLTRDGEETHTFSHVERAVHEAAQIAQELNDSGEPAELWVQDARGRMIEIDLEVEPPTMSDAEETGPEGEERTADAAP